MPVLMTLEDGQKKYMQTIEEFAEEHGVTHRTVQRWLAANPPLPHIKPRVRRGRGHVNLILMVDGRNWVAYHAPVEPIKGRKSYYFE